MDKFSIKILIIFAMIATALSCNQYKFNNDPDERKRNEDAAAKKQQQQATQKQTDNPQDKEQNDGSVDDGNDINIDSLGENKDSKQSKSGGDGDLSIDEGEIIPGTATTTVLIEMEDGHDQSFGEVITCIQGDYKFNYDLSKRLFEITATKKHQGSLSIVDGAINCNHEVSIKVTHKNGKVDESRKPTKPSPTFTVDFQVGSKIEIIGYSINCPPSIRAKPTFTMQNDARYKLDSCQRGGTYIGP